MGWCPCKLEREVKGGRDGAILTVNGNVASSEAFWVGIRVCLIREYGICLYSKPVMLVGINSYTGFCRFLILGSVSVAIHHVGVGKMPDSTVMPLKARK